MSHDGHTDQAATHPSTTPTTRRFGRLPKILAIAVLAGGSLLMGTGAAQAAVPAGTGPAAMSAGPIKCADGRPYTVTVGGVDGCEAPLTEPEQNCVESGAPALASGAGGGAAAGGATGGPPGAAVGGLASGSGSGLAGCAYGAATK